MITLRCGRKVEVAEYGDPAGAPALWFHGAGSSRLEAGFLDTAAREHGLRIIAPDRPGVGGSDPDPGRTVVGYAADMAEVLDTLKIEKAAVGGLSNGGLFTMAVSARIPERVLRAVPLNPTSPAYDPAARAALGRAGKMAYSYMKRDPVKAAAQTQKPAKPNKLVAAITRLTNADRRLFDDPVKAAAWAANTAELKRQPDSGYLAQELTQATAPWGFDHLAVSVPVSLVSGEKDAGLGYAKIWARDLPHGRLVLTPGGHSNILDPAVAQTVVKLLLGRS